MASEEFIWLGVQLPSFDPSKVALKPRPRPEQGAGPQLPVFDPTKVPLRKTGQKLQGFNHVITLFMYLEQRAASFSQKKTQAPDNTTSDSTEDTG